MPWAMSYLELELTDRNLIALLQPTCRYECLAGRKAEHLRLCWHLIDPELITQMRTFNRQRVTTSELSSGSRMIEVGVRDQNFLERESV